MLSIGNYLETNARGIAFSRFTHEQMNVLRHHYKPDHVELKPATHLLRDGEEDIASTCRSQKGLASITAGRDEVQVTLPVKSSQGTETNLHHRAEL
jgi:hypothetical protein